MSVAAALTLTLVARQIVFHRTTIAEAHRRRQRAVVSQRSYSPLGLFKKPHKIIQSADLRTALASGFASALDRLGHVLTIGILLGDPYAIIGITFHLMSPAVNSASSWARIFYFDFSHPRNAAWRPMMKSLQDRLLQYALPVAVFLACLASAPVIAYFPKTVWFTCSLVIPIVISNATLSPLLIIAFSYGLWRTLIVFWMNAGILTLLSIRLLVDQVNADDMIIPLSIAVYLILGGFVLRHLIARAAIKTGAPLPSPIDGPWPLVGDRQRNAVIIKTTLAKPLDPIRLNRVRAGLAMFGPERISCYAGGSVVPRAAFVAVAANSPTLLEQAARDFGFLLLDLNVVVSDIALLAGEQDQSRHGMSNQQIQDRSRGTCNTAVFTSETGLRWGSAPHLTPSAARLCRLQVDIYLREAEHQAPTQSATTQPFSAFPLLEQGMVRAIIFGKRPLTPEWQELISDLHAANLH